MSNEQAGSSRLRVSRTLFMVGLGFLLGSGAVTALLLSVGPGMMIITEPSRLGFDETVHALEDAIVQNGWVHSGTTDMNVSMAKHGVHLEPKVKVIKLCKAEYAKSVLETDRFVSALMPCSMAVWEDDGGAVFVSKMNTGLMGKLFGGNVAAVMGGAVSSDEQAILAGIVRQ